MKHYGDITKLNGAELPIVDVVCGGSPCQDLSVAGKRAGLDGARSGLFMEQIRVIKEMRDECARQLSMRGADEHIRPRYMVWENVPGAFSSNKGEDFRAVLEETARIADKDAVIPRLPNGEKWTPSGCIMGEGWSIAWRVHDAQFWGVPQRRKRISLVADFGGASAPEILFERKSLSRDLEQGEQERETITGIVGENTDKASANCLNPWDVQMQNEATCWDGSQTSPTLTANNAGGAQRMPDKENFNAVISFYPQMKAESQCYRDDDVSNTLVNGTNPGFQNGIITYGLDRASFNQGKNALYDISIEEEKAQTIVAKGPGGVLAKR